MKTTTIAIACMFVGLTPVTADSLLLNGDFEIGGYGCGGFCQGPCNVTHWTAWRVDYVDDAAQAYSGLWFIDLNQCATGWLYQDVACEPGLQVELRFALGAVTNGCGNSPASKRVRVTFADLDIELTVDPDLSQPTGHVEWYEFSYVVLADSTVERLRFDSLDPGCTGAYLDVVSVVPKSSDCDADGISDADEIAAGAADLNGNGIPDNCECIADLTGNGEVNGADISVLLGFWGKVPAPLPAADINQDGHVDGLDLAVLLGSWGPCK